MSIESSEMRWLEDCKANFDEAIERRDCPAAEACLKDARERGHDVTEWLKELEEHCVVRSYGI